MGIHLVGRRTVMTYEDYKNEYSFELLIWHIPWNVDAFLATHVMRKQQRTSWLGMSDRLDLKAARIYWEVNKGYESF